MFRYTNKMLFILYLCRNIKARLEVIHWITVLICLALDGASKRLILDLDGFGPGCCSWKEHGGPGQLWQLGGRFWTETLLSGTLLNVPRPFVVCAHGDNLVMHVLDGLQACVSIILPFTSQAEPAASVITKHAAQKAALSKAEKKLPF